MRYLGGEPIDTEAAFARWQAHWDEHGFGQLAVEERASGDLVGRAGPQFHRVWPGDPEVGWAVDPNRWGEGIATEMGGACVAWALGELGFRRVVSITTEANVASLRVMAKLGFSLLTRLDDPVLGLELWVHSLGPSLD